jgi:hypothetical protein
MKKPHESMYKNAPVTLEEMEYNELNDMPQELDFEDWVEVVAAVMFVALLLFTGIGLIFHYWTALKYSAGIIVGFISFYGTIRLTSKFSKPSKFKDFIVILLFILILISAIYEVLYLAA